MKKTLLAVALLIATMGAKAQSNVSYGIKGGLNLSNQTLGNTNELTGYKVGMFAEYAISPNLFLQPGLEFTTKGWKSHSNLVQSKTQNNYLEMPVNLVYKIHVSPGFKVSFNAGPYAALGVYGKSTTSGVSIETLGNSINRWDFGLGGGVGLEYGNYLFNVGYEYGLSDVYNGPGANGHNCNAFFTLGYRF